MAVGLTQRSGSSQSSLLLILLEVCAVSCSHRNVASDGNAGGDGVQPGADATITDDTITDGSLFCTGPSRLVLQGQRVSVSSASVVVTRHWTPMYSAYGLVTFRFTIPLPLGAGEQGVLGVSAIEVDTEHALLPLSQRQGDGEAKRDKSKTEHRIQAVRNNRAGR